MTDEPREAESTDSGQIDRREMLKGVAAGLTGTAAAGTAATGTAAAGTVAETASAWENEIVLEADERPVEYRIEVSGRIEKTEESGRTDRIVHDHVAVGTMVRTDDLDDVRDGYRFTGRLLRLDVLRGSLSRVWVNGERVHPDEFGDADSPAVAVLEDFEDGAWPDDWARQTSGYAITDDALVERFAVEASGSLGYPDVRKPTADTPRGQTYTVQTVPGSSEAYPVLLTNCQSRDVLDDCYAAWLRTGLDELRLQVRSDGSGTVLEEVPTKRSLEPGAEYAIALDVGLEHVRARGFASDGTQLATTGWHTDTTHSGGTLGLYADGTSEAVAGTRYDQCVQWLLETS
jgi:hypothetical protein